MRLGLTGKVKKLENVIKAEEYTGVAIIRAAGNGYIDQYGRQYKSKDSIRAAVIIIDDVPHKEIKE